MFGVGAGDKGFSTQIKSRITPQRPTPKNSSPINCASAEIIVISVKNLRNYAAAAFFALQSRCNAARLVLQTVFLLLLPLKSTATKRPSGGTPPPVA
jgi:hypothetical protein